MLTANPQSHARHRVTMVALLLLTVTVAVYWPLLRNGFVNYDDPVYVTANPRTQAGLCLQSLVWAVSNSDSSNWHPLTWFSHMVDCQLYQLKPAGHHLTSLLLHLASTVLLFQVLRRMTGALWRSAFVAGLFAIHPLHVESVAWVAERKDVLSGLFFMLTLWAYSRYVEAFKLHSQRATRFYLLALGLFALGLMSKPMLVTLPFVLLLLDLWPLRRWEISSGRLALKGLSPLLREKVPFFALSAASCVVTFLAQRSGGAVMSLTLYPFPSRLANAFLALGRYLGNTLWPLNLAVFYPYAILTWDRPLVVGSVLLLVAATAAVVKGARQRPYLGVGWFWFVGMLVPVIGLVQVGDQALADRYTYLPLIGVFVLLVWGAVDALGRWNLAPALGWVCAAVVLAACGVITASQVRYWRDTKTLFTHAAEATSANYLAQAAIATELATQGKLDEALAHCQLALRIFPQYPEGLNTLGNIYARQGSYEAAITSFQQAAQARPTYADPYHGMADVLVKQRKYAEAEAMSREALKRAPEHVGALFCLASTLHDQGRIDEAVAAYQRLLELDPKFLLAHRYLGNALVLQGQPQAAMAEFRLVLNSQPTDADTHVALGVLLLDEQRFDEATAEFLEATRLQPTNALAHYQLALVHQHHQELPEAIRSYRAALAAQPNWPEALNNLAWVLASNPNAGLRNGADAVRLAERACELTGYKEPLLIGTLAAAYAEAGRFLEAVRTAEVARDLAQAHGQEAIARRNAELLELYRAGRAYHEAP